MLVATGLMSLTRKEDNLKYYKVINMKKLLLALILSTVFVSIALSENPEDPPDPEFEYCFAKATDTWLCDTFNNGVDSCSAVAVAPGYTQCITYSSAHVVCRSYYGNGTIKYNKIVYCFPF